MSKELEAVEARLIALRQRKLGREQAIQRIHAEGGAARLQRIAKITEEVSGIQQEIDGLELQERRLVDQQEQQARADEAAQALKLQASADADSRFAAEERGFWFRRFHTSLAIAHGGALAAISSKLLDKDVAKIAVKAALVPMTVFALGLVAAGLIPYALYEEKRRRAGVLANVSAGLFAGGLIVTLGALAILAWPSLVDGLR